MSGERNVSVPEEGRAARTSPKRRRVKAELTLLVDGAFQPISPADLRCFFARRSTEAGRRIAAANERAALLAEVRDHARAMTRLRKEMREWECSGIRSVRVRMDPQRQKLPSRAPKTTITKRSQPLRPLPRYRGPIIDRAGRRGIFFSIVYDGAKKNRLGVAKRRIVYMFKPDHAELFEGRPIFYSNMGLVRAEIESCAEALERANRSARSNAIVGFWSVT